MDEPSEVPATEARRAPDPLAGFFWSGLMLGAAVGAAIGLLYAPRPGAEVRRDLARRAETLSEQARARRSSATDTPAPSASSPAEPGEGAP